MPERVFGGTATQVGYSASNATGIHSFDYTMNRARVANNGQRPVIVFGVRSYATTGSSSRTGDYMGSGPDVPGTQTTQPYTVPANGSNQNWQPVWFLVNNTDAFNLNYHLLTPNANTTTRRVGLTVFQTDNAYMNFDYADGSHGSNSQYRPVWAYQYAESPTEPTNFSASPNGGQSNAVDLRWGAPSSNGDNGITGYNIYRNGNYLTSVNGGTYGYTDTGLGVGWNSYTIYAKNDVTDWAGTTGPAANTSVWVIGTPSPPQNVAYYANAYEEGRYDIYWNAPADRGGINDFFYDMYVDDQFYWRSGVNETQHSVVGLQPGTNHRIYIYASQYNPGGPQFWSGRGGETVVTAQGRPSAPYNLTATWDTNTQNRININWAQSVNNGTYGGTALTYYARIIGPTNRAGSTTVVRNVGTNVTSAALSGPPFNVGDTYNINLYAENPWTRNNGTDPVSGAASNTVSSMSPGYPTVPQNVSIVQSTNVVGRVTVSWSAPANTAGTITGYQVSIYRYDAAGNQVFVTSNTTQSTSLVFSNLASPNTYYYDVAVANQWSTTRGSANGVSPYAVTAPRVSQVLSGVPSAPLSLTATASPTTAGLVTLNWTTPSYTGTNGITAYSIYNAQTDALIERVATTATTYSFQGIAGNSYYFYVKASNQLSDAALTTGPQSNPASASALGDADAPTSVTLSVPTNVYGRIKLTWAAPQGNILGYNVFRNGVKVAYLNALQYTDDNLPLGVEYAYYITAANINSASGLPSMIVRGTPSSFSYQTAANFASTDVTNVTMNGTFALTGIGSVTYKGQSYYSMTYRRTYAGTFPETAVPVGTLVDNTNVLLNGSYYITVPNATQIQYSLGIGTINQTAVTGGNLHDKTNDDLSGTNISVTAVDPPNRIVQYRMRTARGSLGTTILNILKQGTVINRTNQVFNGVYVIDMVTENTFGYPRAAADVPESVAAGTATNNTNINYFNGTYNVARVNSPTSISYNRIDPDLSAPLTNLVTNPSFESTSGTYVLRTNMCPNPTFTTDLTGWTTGTAITATRDTANSAVGSATTSAIIQKTALADTNNTFTFSATGLTVGGIYTLSAYFKNLTGDAGAALVVTGLTASNPIVPTSSWVRREITFTANATTMTVGVTAGAATLANSQFYVDGFMLERSTYALAYFDGSMTATTDFSYGWSGTANNSASTMLATNVTGVTSQAGTATTKAYSSRIWASASNTRSLAMITKGTGTDQWVDIGGLVTLDPNKQYTFVATVRTTTTVNQPNMIRLAVQTGGSVQTVNSNINGGVGTYRISGTFNTNGRVSGDYIRLYYATPAAEQILYWDDMLIFEGSNPNVPYFDGNSTDTSVTDYSWTGTAHASTSKRTTTLPTIGTNILEPYGAMQRTFSPAHVEILYRSGWLG